MTTYTILGIADDVTVCDCCGKTMLRDTVALENSITGAVVHFGSHCAARAMRMPEKKASLIVERARAAERARPVIESIVSAVAHGAKAAAAVAAGRETARGVTIRGGNVLVTGYDSWGLVNVDWVGGRKQIKLNA